MAYIKKLKKLKRLNNTTISSNLILEFTDYLIDYKELLIKETSKELKFDEKDLIEEFNETIKSIKEIKNVYYKNKKPIKIKLPNYNFNSKLIFKPKGTILMVTPSSSPFLSNFFLPFVALYAGNKIILKISNSLKTLINIFKQIIKKINLKLLIITSEPNTVELINRLFEEDAFDCFFFMGSSKYSNHWAKKCIDYNKEFIKELEGNDLLFLDKGFNYDKYLSKIISSFTIKNGQDCDCIRGLLIHKTDSASFLKKVVNLTKNKYFKLIKKSSLINSLTHYKNISKSNKVILKQNMKSNEISLAVIKLSSDNFPNDTFFYPLIWVFEYQKLSDAINFINKNKYRITLSIFSNDKQIISKIINNTAYARYVVNSIPLDINPLIPWGGLGLSATGGVYDWFRRFSNKCLIEENNKVY